MLPWRVPCSPEKGFLKKRGMPARCTSVGVMCWVWVWACVCESVHCERVLNSCRRTRQRERERNRERERERERERLSLSHTHSLPLSLSHTHSHTHQKDLSPIPHGHTLRCPRSIPSSSCVALAPFSCTTTSLLRYTSRHTWPTLLSPAAHPVTSDGLSPLQPHVPLPPIPPRPPRISERGAGGGRDGPWATQGMSMGYGEIV